MNKNMMHSIKRMGETVCMQNIDYGSGVTCIGVRCGEIVEVW